MLFDRSFSGDGMTLGRILSGSSRMFCGNQKGPCFQPRHENNAPILLETELIGTTSTPLDLVPGRVPHLANIEELVIPTDDYLRSPTFCAGGEEPSSVGR